MYVHWTTAVLFLIVFGGFCFGCGAMCIQYKRLQDAEAAANKKQDEFIQAIVKQTLSEDDENKSGA